MSKIEQFLEPAKERGGKVRLFFGTVLGVNGSQLVIEGKSGGVVYATSYVYCDVGDLVSCLTDGTTIIAFAAKDAQRVADDLNKIGLVYTAGAGITIDENNKINADVTESDIQTLSSQIAGKADSSHTHTAEDTTSGVFSIDRIPTIPASKLSGMIPNEMLPSYVDDVAEGTLNTFPTTGETGKIYVDTSTNKTYRWSGSQYVEISESLALGETSSTAFRGDRGKVAYNHTSRTDNPHNVTPSQIGAAEEDHTHSVNDLTDMPSWSKAETKPTYTANEVGAAPASHGHEISDVDGLQDALDSKAASNHTHANATTAAAGFLPKLGGGTTNYLRADGTWAKPPDTNTTYSNMSGATTSAAGKAGLVPAPSAGAATRYLRSDGTWSIPPDTNTTYSAATTSAAGLMSAADKTKLNGIATGAQVNTITGIKGNAESAYRTGNVNLTPANIGAAASSHTHAATQITGLTASRALATNSSGKVVVSSVTNTELSYLNGVTSNVQTQLNGKSATSHTHSYTLNGTATTNPSWYAPASAGTAGQYLVSSGNGAPTWATIQGGVVFMPNGYPEGSVYLTYDPDFNPAETFGGTWTKETSTYLFLGITIWKCAATPNQYFSPLDMYPIGTAFMTYDSDHNPAAEFGGTWTLETQTYLFLGIKIYKRVA